MASVKKALLHGLLLAAFAVVPVGAGYGSVMMPTDKDHKMQQKELDSHKKGVEHKDMKDKEITRSGVGFGVYYGRPYYRRGFYRPYYRGYYSRPYYRSYSRPYYYRW